MPEPITSTNPCRVVVIWIDWYAYHLARFAGLQEALGTRGEVVGLELVGGAGVHTGMRFREERPDGLPIRTLLPDSSWAEASQFTLARLVWQELQALSPGTVLVPGYYTLPALVSALWARIHGRTSVLMTESTAYDHPRSSWKEKTKGYLLRKLFTWAICGGGAHRTYLQQLGFPADRIARFYNVVGNKAIAAGVAQLQKTGCAAHHHLPQRFFLFVGRLASEKNVRGLWTAWLRYRAAGGTWGLVFAGDGPEAPALKDAMNGASMVSDADRRCCEDVIFAGHCTAEQLLPFYAFAGCLVLPSTREPWGLVVNEAMAAGLPVIVSNRCGSAATLVEHNRNGLIFDPSNDQNLVASLHKIASLSASELEAMGQASRERIEVYSPRNFGREVEAIARQTEQSDATSAGPVAAPDRKRSA